jgi:hypothetical protein
MNVQLTGGEKTVVYQDLDTKRILCFGIEGAAPVVPPGTRYRSEVLLHARDIERWSKRYQIQCAEDREQATVRRLEAERPFRKAVRDAIVERNSGLDQWNQAINLRMLDAQDTMYERILESRRRAEVCIVAEKYEATSDSVKVALDSPHIRPNNA